MSMEWISVNERLPETRDVGEPHGYKGEMKSEQCLTFGLLGWGIAGLVDGVWINGETGEREFVTHWMPLPPAPETGREAK